MSDPEKSWPRAMKTVTGFIAASVVSGLALAFLLVAWRPELIQRAAPAPVASEVSARASAGRAAPA
ncbi:MAG: hypothetical protein ACREUG_15210, partial [Steroidobacteraceae bacterium]